MSEFIEVKGGSVLKKTIVRREDIVAVYDEGTRRSIVTVKDGVKNTFYSQSSTREIQDAIDDTVTEPEGVASWAEIKQNFKPLLDILAAYGKQQKEADLHGQTGRQDPTGPA